jgi:hypothetical protein
MAGRLYGLAHHSLTQTPEKPASDTIGARHRPYTRSGSMLSDVAISLAGIVLIVAVLKDFIKTTLRLEGGGRLSTLLMAFTWRVSLYLHRLLPHRRMLSHAGVAALLANIFLWTALLWLGWLLLFLPHAGSVLSAASGEPADFWSTVYFVGYSLITLGVGDYVPNGPLFQVATVLAAISGFFLLTLSVTYLVPVVAAVVQARQLAAQIFLLGRSPQELVQRLVEAGKRRDQLQLLHGFVGPIVLLSQHHFAYPVLKYFPSSRRQTSAAVGMAVLDESLTLLLFGLTGEDRAPASRTGPIRRAIEQYLRVQVSPDVKQLPPPPPAPSLEPLRRAGLSAASDHEFASRLKEVEQRRSLLLALVRQEEREWSDVSGD